MDEVEAVLRTVLGDDTAEARQRRLDAVAATGGAPDVPLEHGELGVRAVARVLDAAGLAPGDRFVDIGSGEGGPVLAAALLHPETLAICRGIEIVPARVERARRHGERLLDWIHDHRSGSLHAVAPFGFLQGDVFDEVDDPGAGRTTPVDRCRAEITVAEALKDSSIALCFSTTWSSGAPRRELPRLSAALHAAMPVGARVIVIDGRLLEGDGWRWEGDLRITTLDTAPYSTARLYVHRDDLA